MRHEVLDLVLTRLLRSVAYSAHHPLLHDEMCDIEGRMSDGSTTASNDQAGPLVLSPKAERPHARGLLASLHSLEVARRHQSPDAIPPRRLPRPGGQYRRTGGRAKWCHRRPGAATRGGWCSRCRCGHRPPVQARSSCRSRHDPRRSGSATARHREGARRWSVREWSEALPTIRVRLREARRRFRRHQRPRCTSMGADGTDTAQWRRLQP